MTIEASCSDLLCITVIAHVVSILFYQDVLLLFIFLSVISLINVSHFSTTFACE